jgi:hypothetical protein
MAVSRVAPTPDADVLAAALAELERLRDRIAALAAALGEIADLRARLERLEARYGPRDAAEEALVLRRAVYVADVSERIVRRATAPRWSLAEVLEHAKRWTSSTGSVLATFDVPLGVPDSYLAALNQRPAARPLRTFIELLASSSSMRHFFTGTSTASDWSVERPFF